MSCRFVVFDEFVSLLQSLKSETLRQTRRGSVLLRHYAASVPAQRAHHEDRLAIHNMPRLFAPPRQPDAVCWFIRRWTVQAIVCHFFCAPVPSGCTLLSVKSRLTAAIRRRGICACRGLATIRSRTPALKQRLMRVAIVRQLPPRWGKPRHLPPCATTDTKTLRTCRLLLPSLPL